MKKKILSLLITIVLSSVFVSCGNDTNTAKELEKKPNIEETAENTSTEKKDLKSIRTEKDEEVFQKTLKDIKGILVESFENSCSYIDIVESDNYVILMLKPLRGFLQQSQNNKELHEKVVENMKIISKQGKDILKMKGFSHDFMALTLNEQVEGEFILSVVNGEVSVDKLND
ncbi:hypothetical protein [Clostridium thermobutyricum]|uniref:hypothetical protein n=1 Tax=Clostridium thermobutyricum TaxID=29372 RepID=UPI0018ABA180|nr:hypothetical protein [Clostridium thermobutyricum]